MWTACHRRPRARLDLMCSAYSQPIPTSASVDGWGDIGASGASFVSPNRRRNVGPDAPKARDGQNERSIWRVFDRRRPVERQSRPYVEVVDSVVIGVDVLRPVLRNRLGFEVGMDPQGK